MIYKLCKKKIGVYYIITITNFGFVYKTKKKHEKPKKPKKTNKQTKNNEKKTIEHFFFYLSHFSETKRFTNVSRISGYTHPVLVVLVTNVNMGILDITCLASKITHVHP